MTDIRYKFKLDSPHHLTCLLIGSKNTIIKETRKVIFNTDEKFIEDWVHLSLKQALDNGTALDEDNYAIEFNMAITPESLLRLFCWLKGLTKQPIKALFCESYSAAAHRYHQNVTKLSFIYDAKGWQESYFTSDPMHYVDYVIRVVNKHPELLTKYNDVLILEDVIPEEQHHFWLDDELADLLEERKQRHTELVNHLKKPTGSFFSKEPNDLKKRIKLHQKLLEIKVEDLMFKYTGYTNIKEITPLLRRIAYAIDAGMELVFPPDQRLKPYNLNTREEGVLVDTQELLLDRYMILTNQIIYLKYAKGDIERQTLTALNYLAKADIPKLVNMANQYLALDKKLQSLEEPPVNNGSCSIV